MDAMPASDATQYTHQNTKNCPSDHRSMTVFVCPKLNAWLRKSKIPMVVNVGDWTVGGSGTLCCGRWAEFVEACINKPCPDMTCGIA
eukprot:7641110-Ditylum_brightwellii.AAC.1